jgi:subtilisin family serine protease
VRIAVTKRGALIVRRTGGGIEGPRRIAVFSILLLLLLLTATGAAALQQPASTQNVPTSRMARTDESLLGLTGSEQVHVVVKLDYDSTATYRGGRVGLAATSPAVTGQALEADAPQVLAYERHAAGVEATFTSALAGAVPAATLGRSLRTVYGGVAVTLPASSVDDVLRLPGVVAVQRDSLEHLLTDASGAFIGAGALYSQLGGNGTAGAGVIVGVLDSGVWPEHPSFADPGTLPAPPPKPDGTPRVCNFGDNPLTDLEDVFVCQNKLISGDVFLDTYNGVVGGERYKDSARDSVGHGTHTATTAAGGPVPSATILNLDRGAVSGLAPGAHVAAYKVCGSNGCFTSDALAAVAQAVLDGVDVINYSISGGIEPFSDPVELAFLDAYAAGVLVAAAAGNEGPTLSTVNHRAPWVMTVAATTQERAFTGSATLTAEDETLTVTGASITGGVDEPAPVVLAGSAPDYEDELCGEPAEKGVFEGAIVVCQRGIVARVAKGHNVAAGGAVGMLLYNPSVQDVGTDTHWLPTIQLDFPQAEPLLAFLEAHEDATATMTAGQKGTGPPDVLAAFSSRGPSGAWLKPDITAPGVQILAGNSPTPSGTEAGPPGQLFQAITGTSMSAPEAAGAAALIAALHPTWTPGQIKSALMTTATTAVVKEDGVTPADPYDVGAGRIALGTAGSPGLTIDEEAADFLLAVADPGRRLALNIPSVSALDAGGEPVATVRTVRNVSGQTVEYAVTATTEEGLQISVAPTRLRLDPDALADLAITVDASAGGDGSFFGEIRLEPLNAALPVQHLPVVAGDGNEGNGG